MRWSGSLALAFAWGAACVSIPDSPGQLDAQAGSGGSSPDGSAGSGGLPLPESGVCPSGFKACDESCVSIDDPAFGCAPEGCLPCGTASRVTSVQCASGVCAVGECELGFGDCNGELADGCELDTSADADNCGACGWSCYGSTCSQGLCAPEVIITGLVGASDILVDADSVYTISSAPVGVPVALKDGKPKAGPSIGYGRALAQDATFLYFANNSAVFRWPKAGGTEEQLTTGKEIQHLAVDDTYLYLADWDDVDADLTRAPKGQLGSAKETIHTVPGARIRSILTDSTTVYIGDDRGVVARYDKSSGAVNEELDYQTKAWGLVLTPDTLYWRGGDAVLKAALGSDTLSPVFPAQGEPRGLALANERLYWTTDKALMMGDPSTQLVRVLTSLPTESRGLTADDEFVYYTLYTAFGDNSGKAYRIRQPPP